MNEVLDFALLGLGVGAVYALAAQGIVLIYRGSGVLNLAHGAIAAIGAYAYAELLEEGVATPVAVAAGVAAGAGLGLAIYGLVMRPLRNAAPLVRLVASLGVLTVLQAGLLGWPADYGDSERFVDGFLSTSTVELPGDLAVGADRLWLLGIASALSATLWWAYRHTRFGLATRAVAENQVAAGTLGLSPDVIAATNWALGGALAALAGVLVVPIVGLSVNQVLLLLIPALAAALVGRFTSFPLTLAGGLVIGVLETELGSGADWVPEVFTQPGWSKAAPFLLIIAVLVAQGRVLVGRGFVSERLPDVGSGRVPVRWAAPTLVASVVVVNGVGLVGYGGIHSSWVTAVTSTAIAAVVGLSLVVVTGYTGQLSLAQYALAGVGGYVAARASAGEEILGVVRLGPLPFEAALGVGLLLTVPVGALLGLLALRTRGVNLAVATLGFALLIERVVLGNADFTGGFSGTVVQTPRILGIDLDPVVHPRRYATFCILAFAVAGLVVANLRRGRAGRRLLAVKANERAATSLGIDVVGAKLFAFSLGSAIAALGGVLLAFRTRTALFSQFNVFESINAVVLTVLGGVGFVGGAVAGAMVSVGGVLTFMTHELLEIDQLTIVLISGLLLVANLVVQPEGIVPALLRDSRRLAGRLSRRRPDRRSPGVDDPPSIPPGPRAARERVSPKSLRVEGLHVRFGGVVAVDDVGFEVRPGEVVGLIGPNGAGKTTIIDAVTGFTRPESGRITLGDEAVSDWSARRRARAGLARSFQSLELFEDMTVEDNLRVAADPRDASAYVVDLLWPRARPLSSTAQAAIDEFELAGDIGRRPSALPHGRRRLVAIARAIATRPSVLLLDEPAAGLDEHESRELGTLVRRLADEWGIGVLLVEHDVSLIMSVCDRVVAVESGRPIASGPPEEVRRDPAVVTAYLGGGDPDADRAGSERAAAAPRVSAPSSAPVLAARRLTAGYGGVPVVRDLELHVEAGEVVTLLGRNGAGKTTTMRALAGLLPPIDGTVTWDGEVTRRPLHHRARQGMAYLPEDRAVFLGLSGAENLRLGGCSAADGARMFPEIEPHLPRRAGLLSGGQQMMLTLARALATDPRVLLCDELSLGLAPQVVARLLDELARAADRGVGVLLVEQHARRALAVADRAYVLDRGRVVLEGPAAVVAERLDEVEDSYLGAADRAHTEPVENLLINRSIETTVSAETARSAAEGRGQS